MTTTTIKSWQEWKANFLAGAAEIKRIATEWEAAASILRSRQLESRIQEGKLVGKSAEKSKDIVFKKTPSKTDEELSTLNKRSLDSIRPEIVKLSGLVGTRQMEVHGKRVEDPQGNAEEVLTYISAKLQRARTEAEGTSALATGNPKGVISEMEEIETLLKGLPN